MKDHILVNKNRIYKIGLNSVNQLTLYIGGQDITAMMVNLTKRKCTLFSSDIDEAGDIHVACVIMDTLTYIKYSNDTVSTVHLMHLPQSFSITSAIVNAENDLRLNYCVKSKDGSAIIEYTKSGDSWQGKNIHTAPEDMVIHYVKKNKNECYVVKKTNNSYMLINAYNPETEIFSSPFEIKCVQGVFDGVVFKTGDTIFFNQDEVAKGEGVFVLDGKHIAVKNGNTIREYVLENGIRFSGEILVPASPTEYILCPLAQDKRILLSSPYPHVRLELQRAGNGGLQQEVYMQQRTLFQLQAEIRSLKARIKRLEEEQKFLVKNK